MPCSPAHHPSSCHRRVARSRHTRRRGRRRTAGCLRGGGTGETSSAGHGVGRAREPKAGAGRAAPLVGEPTFGATRAREASSLSCTRGKTLPRMSSHDGQTACSRLKGVLRRVRVSSTQVNLSADGSGREQCGCRRSACGALCRRPREEGHGVGGGYDGRRQHGPLFSHGCTPCGRLRMRLVAVRLFHQ